LSIIKNYNY